MAEVRRRLHADPATIYDFLVHVDTYPEWLIGAKEAHPVDDSWPSPGAAFSHHVGVGPIQVHDHSTITAMERNHTLDMEVRVQLLFRADVHFELLPDGDGTIIVMREIPKGPFKLLTPVVAPLIRMRNNRSLAALERRLDGRAAAA